MSPDHETSDRVYRALKGEVLHASIPNGSLNIALLSRHYGTSATPVREALLRLVGEGLVELPFTGGFATCALSAGRLRDLYEFNMHLLLMAVRLTSPISGMVYHRPVARSEFAIEEVFLDLARRSGNMMLVESVARMNDRLHYTRLLEARRLGGIAEECSNLAHAVGKSLRTAILRYHRRRIQRVENLVTFRNGPGLADADM